MITAIMLNAAPAQYPTGAWQVLNHEQEITGLEGLHAARLAALAKVTTEYCAYIDRDDTLPSNTQEQVTRIVAQMKANGSRLAYTDYSVVTPSGSHLVQPGQYSWVKHMVNLTLIHQLAVMRTDAAQEAARRLPTGLYWTEFLLYAELAKTHPLYIPEVGYVYDKKVTGMHVHPDIALAQANSLQWHLRHAL